MSSPQEDPLIREEQGCQTRARCDLQVLARASQSGGDVGPPGDNIFSVFNTIVRAKRVSTTTSKRTKRGGASQLAGPLLGPSDHLPMKRSDHQQGQARWPHRGYWDKLWDKELKERIWGFSQWNPHRHFAWIGGVERRKAQQQKRAGSF